jgi:predicted component of type VI protein secretion system
MQQRETTAVPQMVLSTSQRVLRRIVVDQPRMTIGRRPYNDVTLDDLTVSGEHAVLHTSGGESVIHDLQSRNGTLVNGAPVMQRVLAAGDRIEIGIYRLHYVIEPVPADRAPATPPAAARVEVLSGPEAGRVQRIDREIVSIADGAGQVAVIARRRDGYYVTHLEGPAYPLVNGDAIGLITHPLRHDDLIELGGTILRFRTEPS